VTRLTKGLRRCGENDVSSNLRFDGGIETVGATTVVLRRIMRTSRGIANNFALWCYAGRHYPVSIFDVNDIFARGSAEKPYALLAKNADAYRHRDRRRAVEEKRRWWRFGACITRVASRSNTFLAAHCSEQMKGGCGGLCWCLVST